MRGAMKALLQLTCLGVVLVYALTDAFTADDTNMMLLIIVIAALTMPGPWKDGDR